MEPLTIRALNSNEGLIINEPQIGWLEGLAVVIIATHSPDQSHAAGVIAYKIRTEANQPRLEKLWQIPDPATVEAKRWFRAPPTRPVIADFEGEPIVWVADNGPEGRVIRRPPPRWQNCRQRSHRGLAYAECQAGIYEM